MVQIANPLPGHATHMVRARADKLIARQRAKFDGLYRLVLLFAPSALPSQGQGARLVVSEFSGLDAFPGRAVLPPAPRLVRSRYRGPVVAPLAGGDYANTGA